MVSIEEYSDKYLVVKGDNLNVIMPLLTDYKPERNEDGNWIIKNKYKEKFIEKQDWNKYIILYTPLNSYGYMSISYNSPNLFKLEDKIWDSVERYLMYKMYQNTAKGEAILRAKTLEKARNKFNIDQLTLQTQILRNKKVENIAKSSENPKFRKLKNDLIYSANKAKFDQNQLLREYLIKTSPKIIINKNAGDYFSYEGNLLGDILMRIRSEFTGEKYEPLKISNLTLEKYSKNTYLLRGGPSYINKFKNLSSKRILKGLLIPKDNIEEVKDMIFKTLPEEMQISIYGQKWIKPYIWQAIDIAYAFSNLKGNKKVISSDVLFLIKDVYNTIEALNTDYKKPTKKFIKIVIKYSKNYKYEFTDLAIKVLWDYISYFIQEIVKNVHTLEDIKRETEKYETNLTETNIDIYEDLTKLESILISIFSRLIPLLKHISGKETKSCLTSVWIIAGHEGYDNICKLYIKKAKKFSAEKLREYLKITEPHMQAIFKHLPNMSGKCKMLFLTLISYINSLKKQEQKNIEKRLYFLYKIKK